MLCEKKVYTREIRVLSSHDFHYGFHRYHVHESAPTLDHPHLRDGLIFYPRMALVLAGHADRQDLGIVFSSTRYDAMSKSGYHHAPRATPDGIHRHTYRRRALALRDRSLTLRSPRDPLGGEGIHGICLHQGYRTLLLRRATHPPPLHQCGLLSRGGARSLYAPPVRSLDGVFAGGGFTRIIPSYGKCDYERHSISLTTGVQY